MTDIESILYNSGPLMSADLAARLSKKNGISVNTASQQIARNKNIQKIKGFFASSQSLCYLDNHKKKYDLYKVLSAAMFKHGKKYWYCLNALKIDSGFVRRDFLECYTNYPIKRLTGHHSFEKVLGLFVKNKILSHQSNEEYYLNPVFSGDTVNVPKSKTIDFIKRNVLDNFISVIQNTGMVSFNTAETFGEFGKFRWGIKGVSYISGLTDGSKPGFLIGDILLGNAFYEKDIDFFIKKLETIQSFKGRSRLFPCLLIDNLDPEALKKLKQRGVVIFFIKEIFGEKYDETLRELFSLLNNIGASVKGSPKKLDKLITELEKYNLTVANGIKGTLFEYFVAHIVQRDFPNINVGRIVFGEDEKHEIDIIAYNGSTVVVIECKSSRSKVISSDVRKWMRKVIPVVREYIKSQELLNSKNITFEYWAMGEYDNEARKLIESQKATAKSGIYNFYNASDIESIIKDRKDKHLSNTFSNFFAK